MKGYFSDTTGKFANFSDLPAGFSWLFYGHSSVICELGQCYVPSHSVSAVSFSWLTVLLQTARTARSGSSSGGCPVMFSLCGETYHFNLKCEGWGRCFCRCHPSHERSSLLLLVSKSVYRKWMSNFIKWFFFAPKRSYDSSFLLM